MDNLRKGFYKFALTEEYKNAAIKEAEEKASMKAKKKLAKQEEKAAKRAAREEAFVSFRNRFKFTEEGEEVSIVNEDEGYSFFFGRDDEQYSAITINSEVLLNEQMKKFEKLSGQALLKRNLKTSPMFIDDEGNLIRVLAIKEVVPETDNPDKAYILLDTKYNYFVVEFSVSRSF